MSARGDQKRRGIRESSAYLSQTAGMLDSLQRHKRSESASRVAGGTESKLGRRFCVDRNQAEAALILRVEQMCRRLRDVRAEIDREQSNLELLESKEQDLELEGTRGKFAQAITAQKTRLAGWRQQQTEMLEMMLRIIDSLKSNTEPKPLAVPPPTSVRRPAADLNSLLSLGPIDVPAAEPELPRPTRAPK